MKYFLFAVLLGAVLTSCHKNNESGVVHLPLDAAFKSTYDFLPGSYWVFQDSVSGAIDSAYILGDTTTYVASGCVLENLLRRENINITIAVANPSPQVTERWNISLSDSNLLSITCSNSQEPREAQMLRSWLFRYPAVSGAAPNYGCVLWDSGGILVQPLFMVSGHSYPNTIVCNHVFHYDPDSLAYNDWFFISPDQGFIKMFFNHPYDSVYRVLNLLRSNIVR